MRYFAFFFFFFPTQLPKSGAYPTLKMHFNFDSTALDKLDQILWG